MNESGEFRARAGELIEAGRLIDRRGWVPATSGNFSARLGDGTIAITVSGAHKGRLTVEDIMRVGADGQSLDGRRPSAETGLHVRLYARRPAVGAVLHTHSPGAVTASRLFGDALVLEGHELLKALAGIDTHEARVTVPIFPNDQDIARLGERVDRWLDGANGAHGYLIAGHGAYTWGASVADALRHVEALEFLFEIENRLYGVTRT